MCLRYVIVCRFSLSLSLTFSTNLLIARALARFTNTVEDDARLAPGEKDRGNRARDKFSFMHSRLVSWRVRLSDYRLSATASDLLLPREIHGRTTVLKQGRSRVIVSRFTTESIISICPSAYHRRLYHTTISYFAKYTGTNVSLSARVLLGWFFSNLDAKQKYLQNISTIFASIVIIISIKCWDPCSRANKKIRGRYVGDIIYRRRKKSIPKCEISFEKRIARISAEKHKKLIRNGRSIAIKWRFIER